MADPAWFISYIGAATGAVGVSIAIYLQLISQKHCPPQYVLFYLTLGSGLILAHVNGHMIEGLPTTALRLLGYLVLIAVQVGSALHIYRRLDTEHSRPTIEKFISSRHN